MMRSSFDRRLSQLDCVLSVDLNLPLVYVQDLSEYASCYDMSLSEFIVTILCDYCIDGDV